MTLPSDAPGAPGIAPTWSSSAKEMVGCALGSTRVWFTVGGGVLNEIYYPRVDTRRFAISGSWSRTARDSGWK